ncbi:MAG TPA: MotA/TolQ/ExbB proton channel family protein [Blastocatellia bacterium]|nr:MotA/TolQ/ExbB proton channel family protein [Blastocatellia bacterium]
MKARSLFSFICATTFFLAGTTAIYNLVPTNNQGAVEAATPDATRKVTQGALEAIGRDGRSLRIDAPVEMAWGVSREWIFGANEAAQITGPASDEAQVFDICEMGIWRHMSRITRIVILILLAMAIWSVVIMAERYITFSAATNQSREFAPKVASSLIRQEIDEAINLSDKYKESHLAIVVSAGLREFRAHQLSGDNSGAVVDASKRALQRATAIKTAEFRRGLSGLATIGSIALFVGIFGTLFGIIDVLEYVTDSAWGGISAAAGGIAEALVTTAAGLAVAVPAVWLFKYFTTKVDKFVVEMDISSAELIDFFLKQRVKK